MENHFGEEIAARYDERSTSTVEVVNVIVDFLTAVAGNGPALEFGIGTGRIAVPFASRGVTVSGIDLSEAMVTRLRAKPGGDE
ncbi:MAG: class I SAM-dependent methyltransferase, partial [Gaiellaceae bacterium]